MRTRHRLVHQLDYLYSESAENEVSSSCTSRTSNEVPFPMPEEEKGFESCRRRLVGGMGGERGQDQARLDHMSKVHV